MKYEVNIQYLAIYALETALLADIITLACIYCRFSPLICLKFTISQLFDALTACSTPVSIPQSPYKPGAQLPKIMHWKRLLMLPSLCTNGHITKLFLYETWRLYCSNTIWNSDRWHLIATVEGTAVLDPACSPVESACSQRSLTL